MTGPDEGFVLGVDLGTSHTVAMVRRPDGRVRPLLFDGQPLLPSAVYVDADGRLHVGRDALRLGHAEPARFEPNPKRHIDAGTVLLGGAEMPVPELFAGLLAAVAQEAVAAVGFLPPAVVTYPATWGPHRRAVLTDALGLAGWPAGTDLVPEPVAAARYFTDVLRRPVPAGSALAVFDFGGGTLDIAVVRNVGVGRPEFEVAASGGAGDLGGLDLDAALVDHLGKQLAGAEPEAWKALTDPSTLAQWRARRQFWEDVRGAKEMLSRSALAPVPVPGVEHAMHLTRDELEAAAGPLIRRGVAEAGSVIRAAGLTPRDLAGLFLVGGSSRVPMVARLLHSELGIAPTVLDQPELPVSEGAILAAPSTAPARTTAAPAAAAPTRDLDYADPVDPWATGEAAALAASGGAPLFPGSGAPAMHPPLPKPADEPWLASTHGDPPTPTPSWLATAHRDPSGDVGGPSQPWTAAPDAAGARAKPYRRKWVWIVAAATVVVIGAGAAAAWVFRPGYPSLDYESELGPAVVVAPVTPVSTNFSDAAVIGDRVYFAGEADEGGLDVVAADAATGERIWDSNKAGAAEGWDRMVGIPAGLALLTDTEQGSGRRRFVILGAQGGDRLWERSLSRDDAVFFVDDVVVLVDRAENRLLGLDLGTGRVRWDKPNITNSSGTATASVHQVTTPADLAGPAGVPGVPFDADLDDDTRIVQISADKSARVLDAGSGEVVATRAGVADYDDPVVAHHDRLIVRESSTPQTIVAYDLNKLGEGQKRVLYTGGTNVQIDKLTPCGDDAVCWVEETGYDGATAKVGRVNAADGSGAWTRDVANAENLVPVGDSVLALRSTSPNVSVSLLDDGGTTAWTRDGVAARLDGGNVLTFSKPLSTTPDDPALAGQHLGDKLEPLGPISDVRTASCSWNTSVIACVRDEDYVIHRFAK